MAKSTAAVIGRVLQIRLHGKLTLDSRQDPLGHHHMEPVCAFSVPPEQDPRLLGEVQAGPALVQSVAHKNKYKYKYKLALLWYRVLHASMRVVFSVQCAEELGRRLSTSRGTESNLYCTYCRFYV